MRASQIIQALKDMPGDMPVMVLTDCHCNIRDVIDEGEHITLDTSDDAALKPDEKGHEHSNLNRLLVRLHEFVEHERSDYEEVKDTQSASAPAEYLNLCEAALEYFIGRGSMSEEWPPKD